MICSRGSLLPKGAIQKRNYFQNYSKFRLQHMRRAITRTCLCTHLKPLRCAKKSMPCLIKKASRCAADCMSKTTVFFIFYFLYNTKILRENNVYLFIWLVQWWKLYYIYIFFTQRMTDFDRLEKKHEWWNNHFSDVFTYYLNLEHFASFFFLAKDSFMFCVKSLFFSFNLSY